MLNGFASVFFAMVCASVGVVCLYTYISYSIIAINVR